jgi:hypothetical protein
MRDTLRNLWRGYNLSLVLFGVFSGQLGPAGLDRVAQILGGAKPAQSSPLCVRGRWLVVEHEHVALAGGYLDVVGKTVCQLRYELSCITSA